MSISLRSQLFRRLVATMLLPILATGGLTYWFALRFAGNTYDQDLLESARSLAAQVSNQQGVATFQFPRAAEEIFVWDTSDSLWFRVESQRHGFIYGFHMLPFPPVADIGIARFYNSRMGNEPVRAVAISLANTVPGDRIIIAVAETLNKRHLFANRILFLVFIPQVLLIIITVLLLRIGVRKGLRSLDELEQAVNNRLPNDLTSLPASHIPAELQSFTGAINGLMERLDLALHAQQRFIANAAHQLRTPMTTLKLQVEQLSRELDPTVRESIVLELRATIDRTARLSNQLLLLARAEPGSQPVHMQRVDLRSIALTTGAQWIPRALARGADLGFEGEGPAAWIMGNELLLGEAINNLIDNALRYGNKGVRITLRVEQTAQGYELVVEDNGPGIPESEQNAVLDRFHRVPGSPSDGSGLGLSIVHEIARAHGTTIRLTSAEAGGLSVRIALVAASSSAKQQYAI